MAHWFGNISYLHASIFYGSKPIVYAMDILF